MQSIIEALFKKITLNGEMREEMHLIIEKLSPEVLELATDVHGNHVIQNFIVRFKATDLPQD